MLKNSKLKGGGKFLPFHVDDLAVFMSPGTRITVQSAQSICGLKEVILARYNNGAMAFVSTEPKTYFLSSIVKIENSSGSMSQID